MKEIGFLWKFKELPFIYKELTVPNNDSDIPNVLPFELKVDMKNGVLTQVENDTVGKMLDEAYSLGSVIAGVIEEENENSLYCDDFLDFFKESLNESEFKNIKVLEIGSGTGFLLSQVKKLGCDVIGIEPGKHCLLAKEKYDVDIIHDFFPTPQIKTKFDVIIMTNVLEHIPMPSDFLKSLQHYLTDDGKLIISVPDEEPFIESGDISTLFHEHYSYFTQDTINYALLAGGFKPTLCKFGKYGGVLLRMAVKNKSGLLTKEDISRGLNLAIDYKQKASIYNKKLKDFLINIKNSNKSLGVYVPSRFINILHECQIDDIKIRFFDDNPSMKNKYYPGFDIPIENRVNLIKKPVDVLLIFSKAFGNKIKQNLIDKIDSNTKIITWEELFDY